MAVPAHDGKGPLFALSSFAAAGNSWSQEDDSWRKTTSHVEMAAWQAGFLLSPQSSALITYLLTLNP
jgi:hypothetical protein